MNGFSTIGRTHAVKHLRPLLVLAIVAGSARWPTPALAKGPARAVIEGPGIAQPIEIAVGPDLATLVTDSNVFAGLWCAGCDGSLPQRPSGELGRRYRVTYTMTFTRRGMGTRSNEVVQYLFPYAAPRPVAYMQKGQRFWMQTTVGGWSLGRRSLRRLLFELGVPRVDTSAPATDVLGTVDAHWPPVLVPAFLVLVLLAMVAFVVGVRRRRQPTGLRA